jgi:hypothetical protein
VKHGECTLWNVSGEPEEDRDGAAEAKRHRVPIVQLRHDVGCCCESNCRRSREPLRAARTYAPPGRHNLGYDYLDYLYNSPLGTNRPRHLGHCFGLFPPLPSCVGFFVNWRLFVNTQSWPQRITRLCPFDDVETIFKCFVWFVCVWYETLCKWKFNIVMLLACVRVYIVNFECLRTVACVWSGDGGFYIVC